GARRLEGQEEVMHHDRLGIEQHTGDKQELEIAHHDRAISDDVGSARQHRGPHCAERHPDPAGYQRCAHEAREEPQWWGPAERVRSTYPPCRKAVERIDERQWTHEEKGLEEWPGLVKGK